MDSCAQARAWQTLAGQTSRPCVGAGVSQRRAEQTAHCRSRRPWRRKRPGAVRVRTRTWLTRTGRRA
eukprot:4385234-Pleurochrysis_carterae.AAC.1